MLKITSFLSLQISELFFFVPYYTDNDSFKDFVIIIEEDRSKRTSSNEFFAASMKLALLMTVLIEDLKRNIHGRTIFSCFNVADHINQWSNYVTETNKNEAHIVQAF